MTLSQLMSLTGVTGVLTSPHQINNNFTPNTRPANTTFKLFVYRVSILQEPYACCFVVLLCYEHWTLDWKLMFIRRANTLLNANVALCLQDL